MVVQIGGGRVHVYLLINNAVLEIFISQWLASILRFFWTGTPIAIKFVTLTLTYDLLYKASYLVFSCSRFKNKTGQSGNINLTLCSEMGKRCRAIN